MEAFQAKLTSSEKKNTKRNSSVLSPDQKEALARMKRIRTARHPHKAVSLLYKTTPFSTACALILDIVDYNGNTQWNFKAADHVENLQAYLECGEDISGTHTSDLINNFVLVERRDKAGNEDAVYSNKGGFAICKIMTFFILPDKDPSINSPETETEYVERELKVFGNELKRILTSPLYNAAMKDHVEGYSEKFANMLYSPPKGPTLPEFISGCSVVVQPIDNITDHVVKSCEVKFESLLHQYDQVVPKFITDQEALDLENSATYSPSFKPDGGPDIDVQTDNQNDVEEIDDDQHEENLSG